MLLTLFLSCCVAFVVARFSFRFNLTLLGLFTRREPAAAAGAAHPALPDVPRHPGAVLVQRLGHAAQQLLGADPRQHRLPDRLLHLRAEQLHEDPAQGALRGGPWSTAPASAAVLPAHAAAVPARRWPHWPRSRSPGSTTSSSGPPCCCSSGDKFPVTSSLNNLRGQFFTDNNLVAAGSVIVGAPDPDHLLPPAEAVRRRPDPGRHQGMTDRRRPSCPAGRRDVRCVLETSSGPRLPRVLHWGADPGPLDARPLAPLVATCTPVAGQRASTSRGRSRCCPARCDGWSGTPGLRRPPGRARHGRRRGAADRSTHRREDDGAQCRARLDAGDDEAAWSCGRSSSTEHGVLAPAARGHEHRAPARPYDVDELRAPAAGARATPTSCSTSPAAGAASAPAAPSASATAPTCAQSAAAAPATTRPCC